MTGKMLIDGPLSVDPKFLKILHAERGEPVNQYTRLVPEAVCVAIIALPENTQPCGREKAANQAKVLLGSYVREPHDPETYTRAIVSILAEQPFDVGKEAIDRITRRNRYLPERADLVDAVEEVLRERRGIVTRASIHLREHKRRAQEREETEKREADRLELRAALGEAWDDWWDIPLLRRMTGMPADFGAGWRAAADRKAFCAAWGTEAPPPASAPEGGQRG